MGNDVPSRTGGSGGGPLGSGGSPGTGGNPGSGGNTDSGGASGTGGGSGGGSGTGGSPNDGGPPPECTAGMKQCNGLQPQTCASTSVWQNAGTPCPFVCSAGSCTGTCTPGSKRCNGLQPQACDAMGSWQNLGAACANVCNGGTCAACTQGAKQCNGLQPQTCDAGGLWQNTGTACPFVCAATTGTCTGSCVPGAKQCSASQPQTCDATGTWTNAGAACGACNPCSTTTGACVVATGAACNDSNACTTGETCQSNGTCGGGSAVTCTVANQCQTVGACVPATGCPAPVNKTDGATCTTGKCSAGNCVQCLVKADCSGTGTTCSAQSTCVCDTGGGYHACGATASPCYSDTDATHCGSSCTDCRQPNANATCGAGACMNTCVGGAAYTFSCPAVAGKPNCSQWDFESTLAGTAGEGWILLPQTPAARNASAGALSNSNAQASSGSRSLAIPYNNGGDVNKYVEIGVKLCAGGQQLNLSGKTIHWRVRMVPPATNSSDPTAPTGYNFLMMHPTGALTGSGGSVDHNSVIDNQWHDLPYDNAGGYLLSGSTYDGVAGIGLHLQQTVPYNGVIYIDEFSLR